MLCGSVNTNIYTLFTTMEATNLTDGFVTHGSYRHFIPGQPTYCQTKNVLLC